MRCMLTYTILLSLLVTPSFALNYFWLSWDPVESAKWYCDQHCFKIGSEVIESIWDSVLVLCPDLSTLADDYQLSKANRKRRHAKEGALWHPLSVWHGLCIANMRRGLENADAIFAEHYRRTGTSHVAWKDCKFLMEHIDTIDFSSKVWLNWYMSQNGSISAYTPKKTDAAGLKKRREWCLIHAKNITKLNRATCDMTEPPQCINEDIPEFKGCKVPGDVISAYRSYYRAKLYTMGVMRYYHGTPIPSWILGCVVTDTSKSKKKPKTKIVPYLLDDEGYVVVKFIS